MHQYSNHSSLTLLSDVWRRQQKKKEKKLKKIRKTRRLSVMKLAVASSIVNSGLNRFRRELDGYTEFVRITDAHFAASQHSSYPTEMHDFERCCLAQVSVNDYLTAIAVSYVLNFISPNLK